MVIGMKRMTRLMLTLLFVGVSVCVVWWGLLYVFQDWLMFPRHVISEPLAGPPSKDIEVVEIMLEEGGRVEAWYAPPPGDAAGRAGPAVVFFHGNAELIDFQSRIMQGYHRLGVAVLLVEYRGYGRSSGEPSQEAIRADAQRFYDQLVGRPEIDPKRVIFHGRSLGGGLAADLATVRLPAALVLESTFQSVPAMTKGMAAPGFLIKNPLRTDQVLRDNQIPVLIFHGSRDEVIPPSHGRALRDLAAHAVYTEFPCGHNDFPGHGNEDDYWDTISQFLRDHGVR